MLPNLLVGLPGASCRLFWERTPSTGDSRPSFSQVSHSSSAMAPIIGMPSCSQLAAVHVVQDYFLVAVVAKVGIFVIIFVFALCHIVPLCIHLCLNRRCQRQRLLGLV